jgi:hypothetical protein
MTPKLPLTTRWSKLYSLLHVCPPYPREIGGSLREGEHALPVGAI